MPKITLYDADGNPVEVDEPESPNIRQMRDHISTLEEQAKRVPELEQALTTLQRTNALRDAGLQFDETKMAALQAVHAGDWTADSVRETAIKLGWADPVSSLPPEEQAALQRLEAARAGGTFVPPNAEDVLDARLREAKSEKELLEIYRQSGRSMVQ